jgi:hypothetical protein
MPEIVSLPYDEQRYPTFTVSTSNVVLSETIRPHLIPYFVRTLVDNNDLQALLKEDRDYKIMSGALVYLNKSGRNNINSFVSV